MLFDSPAARLPVATIRSHSPVARWASLVRGSRAAGWRWLRPRLVPVLVAVTGMFAVLGSAEYLTRLARRTPTQATMPATYDPPREVAVVQPASEGVLTIEQGVTPPVLFIDGNPAPAGTRIELPSQPLLIRLVPANR